MFDRDEDTVYVHREGNWRGELKRGVSNERDIAVDIVGGDWGKIEGGGIGVMEIGINDFWEFLDVIKIDEVCKFFFVEFWS